MTFDHLTTQLLTGDTFSNNARIRISQPERRITYRIERLESIVTGKSVIHLGCADHLPLIDRKIAGDTWLHGRIARKARRCLGFDIDEAAVAHLKHVHGRVDVICRDIVAGKAPEIAAERWNYIILGEILEHIDNPVGFLTRLRELYATEIERAILTVPNAFAFDAVRSSLRHHEFINSDHRYFFTPYTLAKVAVRAGFAVHAFEFCEGWPVGARDWWKAMMLRAFPARRDTVLMELVF